MSSGEQAVTSHRLPELSRSSIHQGVHGQPCDTYRTGQHRRDTINGRRHEQPTGSPTRATIRPGSHRQGHRQQQRPVNTRHGIRAFRIIVTGWMEAGRRAAKSQHDTQASKTSIIGRLVPSVPMHEPRTSQAVDVLEDGLGGGIRRDRLRSRHHWNSTVDNRRSALGFHQLTIIGWAISACDNPGARSRPTRRTVEGLPGAAATFLFCLCRGGVQTQAA